MTSCHAISVHLLGCVRLQTSWIKRCGLLAYVRHGSQGNGVQSTVISARLIAMSGVIDINDPQGGETWHLRQLWQFAKNRGYSVKLEDDRLWLTPSGQGNAGAGRSFPDTRAGMQAARAWLTEPVKLGAAQSEVEQG